MCLPCKCDSIGVSLVDTCSVFLHVCVSVCVCVQMHLNRSVCQTFEVEYE